MKKFTAFILSFLMVVSCISIGAFAEEIYTPAIAANVDPDQVAYDTVGAKNLNVLIDGEKALDAAGWGSKDNAIVLFQNKLCTDVNGEPKVEVVYDLGQKKLVDKVDATFYHDYMSMIGLPDGGTVALSASVDGNSYASLGTYNVNVVPSATTNGAADCEWDVNDCVARYIKYTFYFGGSPFADKPTWEFIGMTEVGVTETSTWGCNLAVTGSAAYYKEDGDEITLTVNVKGITFTDGISYVSFRIYYDAAHVALKDGKEAVEAEDFSAFLTKAPEKWALQAVKVGDGYVEITAATESKTLKPIAKLDGEIVFTIPFTVTNAAIEELTFKVPTEYAECGNSTLTISEVPCNANDFTAKTDVTVPDGAIMIDSFGNYAVEDTTILARIGDAKTLGEISAITTGSTRDYNYYYFAICDAEGVVVEINTKLGRSDPAGLDTDGRKGNMEIPEGGFAVGYNCSSYTLGHTEANAKKFAAIKVGDKIAVYNVNLAKLVAGETKVLGLYKACFTIVKADSAIQPEPLDTVPDGFVSLKYAGYRHEGGASVIIAENGKTVGDLVLKGDAEGVDGEDPDMNYWEILVVDANGEIIEINSTLGRPQGAKTDTVCPEGGFIIGFHGAGHVKEYAVGGTITLVNILLPGVRMLKGYKTLTDGGFVYKAKELPPEPPTPEIPDADAKTLWLTHFNNPDAEGAGVIFTEAYKALDYWRQFAFAPTEIEGVYMLTEESEANGTTLTIPEGGFVYGVNVGNNWPKLIADNNVKGDGATGLWYDDAEHMTMPNYISAGIEAMWADVATWNVGDTFKFWNITYIYESELKYYEEGYECKAAYKPYVEEPEPPVAVQPDDIIDLSAGDVAIDYAGYKHVVDAVIIIAEDGKTVGDLVIKGDKLGIGDEDPDMNYWEILVVDKDGAIIEINSTLGRPAGVKTDTVCPEGGFIIGFHGTGHVANYEVGGKIELKNILLDKLNLLEGNVSLDRGGFTYTAPVVDNPVIDDIITDKKFEETEKGKLISGFNFGDKVENYVSDSIKVFDATGKALSNTAFIGTGCIVKLYNEKGEVIDEAIAVVYGDLDGNGVVETKDYVMVKRIALKTIETTDTQKLAADIDSDGDIAAKDYVCVKRAVLGTYDIFAKRFPA